MTQDKSKHSNILKITGIILIILVAGDIFVRFTSIHKAPAIPLPEVVIQNPELRETVEYVTQTGNTVAFNSVNLVARVEGYLNEITFTDGTVVKKNTPLFVIEPEPYMAKLQEAKATVAAQKAILDYSSAEYARQKRMYRENATSLNNVEKWLAKNEESKADLDKAKANEIIAAINYSYTHISAPFDGRIGRHLVDQGNLVGNGAATTLATIDQLDPIYVYFNLNELDLLTLREAARKYGYTPNKLKQIPVQVSLQNAKGYNFEGKLDFINTGLNSSTGTMEFRALLPNRENKLVPGLYVQVRVAITKPTKQLTLPDTCILYDQIGSYVLTIDNNDVVVLKRVTLGSVDQGHRTILTGLDKSDRVIVNGLQFATPGNKVSPKQQGDTA